jgi:hypothetical protein
MTARHALTPVNITMPVLTRKFFPENIFAIISNRKIIFRFGTQVADTFNQLVNRKRMLHG